MRLFSSIVGVYAAAALLVGCTSSDITKPPPTTGGAVVEQPTAGTSITPLGNTIVDDKAIDLAFDGLELAKLTVDAWLATGKLVPNSMQAMNVANMLEGTDRWLLIARKAQKAGEARSAAAALDQAAAAYSALKAQLQDVKGR